MFSIISLSKISFISPVGAKCIGIVIARLYCESPYQFIHRSTAPDSYLFFGIRFPSLGIWDGLKALGTEDQLALDLFIVTVVISFTIFTGWGFLSEGALRYVQPIVADVLAVCLGWAIFGILLVDVFGFVAPDTEWYLPQILILSRIWKWDTQYRYNCIPIFKKRSIVVDRLRYMLFRILMMDLIVPRLYMVSFLAISMSTPTNPYQFFHKFVSADDSYLFFGIRFPSLGIWDGLKALGTEDQLALDLFIVTVVISFTIFTGWGFLSEGALRHVQPIVADALAVCFGWAIFGILVVDIGQFTDIDAEWYVPEVLLMSRIWKGDTRYRYWRVGETKKSIVMDRLYGTGYRILWSDLPSGAYRFYRYNCKVLYYRHRRDMNQIDLIDRRDLIQNEHLNKLSLGVRIGFRVTWDNIRKTNPRLAEYIGWINESHCRLREKSAFGGVLVDCTMFTSLLFIALYFNPMPAQYDPYGRLWEWAGGINTWESLGELGRIKLTFYSGNNEIYSFYFGLGRLPIESLISEGVPMVESFDPTDKVKLSEAQSLVYEISKSMRPLSYFEIIRQLRI